MAESGKARYVGPWRLIEKLGEGGNAIVWRAVKGDDGGPEIALKVLKSSKVGGEPYHRFKNEVAALERVDDPGVLPLLEAHLPEPLSKGNPAWLAMPVATPLDDALAGASLEQVVAACATAAETLARLRSEHDLGHRDVKPGNLYELGGQCLVGDFGLVSDPSGEAITQGDRPLGPLHFAASEMILNPGEADPAPADVYSLAKTLWVLAAEQRYPPDGHQTATVDQWSIARLRPHPKASQLDRLIDQATHLRPENRPTMKMLAAELRAWLALDVSESDATMAAAVARVREAVTEHVNAEQLRDSAKEVALLAARAVQERLAPLEDILRQAHPGMKISAEDNALNAHLRTHQHLGGPSVEWRWQRIAVLKAGQDFVGYGLRQGVSVELLDTEELTFRAAAQVSYDKVWGLHYEWQSDDLVVPAAPIAAERAVQQIVGELSAQTEAALNAFVAHIPGG